MRAACWPGLKSRREKNHRGALVHMRELVAEAGRDPQGLRRGDAHRLTKGLEQAAAEMSEWHELGVSHASLNTMYAGLEWPTGHIDALRRFAKMYRED
jgi:hypothetical protein